MASPPAVAPEDLQRATILAWQAALEGAGFSPGVLDGLPGPKTDLATRAWQAAAEIPVSGQLCPATVAGLAISSADAVVVYTIAPEDPALVDPCPPDWIEKSRRKALLYPSLANLVAERFHTSERCLAWLNPGVDLSALVPGSQVRVPRNVERAPPAAGCAIEIDLGRKVILLVDAAGAVRGLLHCSVARDVTRVRRGDAAVQVVVEDPSYTFDPAMWPEVTNVTRKLLIPPGPRNPVGIRWIGLDRPGVGIHGSPEPANIGKTGSHGCFRLTNWDAAWLSSGVTVGTPVRIVDRSPSLDLALSRVQPTAVAGTSPP